MEVIVPFFEALLKSPFQAVVSLIIFLLALPLIMKGLRDKPVPHEDPVPIQIESPWMIIELNTISTNVQQIGREVRELSLVVERLVALIQNNNRPLN